MLTEEYTVRLDAFSGPMDLLLHLIRRAEIDVSEIALAEITDQYLAFLEDVSDVDVEVAGEFLVIAATLIEVKSRLLAPAEDSARAAEHDKQRRRAEPEDSPAVDLVKQLLAYRAYRDAADELLARADAWRQRWPLASIGTPKDALAPSDDLDIGDLSLFDLMQCYARLAETVQFDRIGDHAVHDDDTPIELHATDVLDRLRRLHVAEGGDRRMTMRALFDERSKPEVIGLFLAVLELVRKRKITVTPGEAGDVFVTLLEDDGAPLAWDDDDVVESADSEDDEDERLRSQSTSETD